MLLLITCIIFKLLTSTHHISITFFNIRKRANLFLYDSVVTFTYTYRFRICYASILLVLRDLSLSPNSYYLISMRHIPYISCDIYLLTGLLSPLFPSPSPIMVLYSIAYRYFSKSRTLLESAGTTKTRAYGRTWS